MSEVSVSGVTVSIIVAKENTASLTIKERLLDTANENILLPDHQADKEEASDRDESAFRVERVPDTVTSAGFRTGIEREEG